MIHNDFRILIGIYSKSSSKFFLLIACFFGFLFIDTHYTDIILSSIDQRTYEKIYSVSGVNLVFAITFPFFPLIFSSNGKDTNQRKDSYEN